MANSATVHGARGTLPAVPAAVRRGLTRTVAFVAAFAAVAWVAELVV